MTTTHISTTMASELAYGDIVEQGGIPYRVAAITGYRNSFGTHAEHVWLVPTHNADGVPMPEEADVYRSTVHVPTGTLAQARWWGPQHVAAAVLTNLEDVTRVRHETVRANLLKGKTS